MISSWTWAIPKQCFHIDNKNTSELFFLSALNVDNQYQQVLTEYNKISYNFVATHNDLDNLNI